MMNYIKRRFSSSDLQDDNDDRQEKIIPRNLTAAISKISNPTTSYTSTDIKNTQSSYTKSNFKMNFPSPSAPTSQANSPTKSLSITSMMNAAKDMVADTFHSGMPAKQGDFDIATHTTHNRSLKDKLKHLLVIDDLSIDWTRYFKGRKIEDYILRVEQVIIFSYNE